MEMGKNILRAGVLTTLGMGLLLSLGCSSSTAPAPVAPTTYDHVVLISIDGMHGSDLTNWVAQNPTSNLAQLVGMGVNYTSVQTQVPSDSFPGLVGITTGGTPNSTGVWYDASFNRTLLPPTADPSYGIGTPSTPGTLVFYDESIDKGYNNALFGNGATPLLNVGTASIDSTALPLDPTTKLPIYPHSYLRVNTIFEVIKGAGLRTAWCDKHAAYDLVNGPSGTGVDDMFTPEINSPVANGDANYTVNVNDTIFNDDLKVAAVVNEINGYDHTGTSKVGVPAIMGMNFQAVSVGEKLHGGGYYDDQGEYFSAILSTGLKGVDNGIGQIVSALKAANLMSSTLIVITAKHGQSPIDQTKLFRFDDSPTTTLDPTNPSPTAVTEYLFSKGIQAYTNANDTCYFLWLRDQTKTAAAVTALQGAPASTVGPISSILSGTSLTAIFNDPTKDPRVPDIIILPPAGTVYTGGSKIAEHGGFNPDDRSVCLLLASPRLQPGTVATPVMTRQVAPTVLKALGLDPTKLQAVVAEGTEPLPSLQF
jgi:Type I phosphodiesterase / nucleotide pyrophosphatase